MKQWASCVGLWRYMTQQKSQHILKMLLFYYPMPFLCQYFYSIMQQYWIVFHFNIHFDTLHYLHVYVFLLHIKRRRSNSSALKCIGVTKLLNVCINKCVAYISVWIVFLFCGQCEYEWMNDIALIVIVNIVIWCLCGCRWVFSLWKVERSTMI